MVLLLLLLLLLLAFFELFELLEELFEDLEDRDDFGVLLLWLFGFFVDVDFDRDEVEDTRTGVGGDTATDMNEIIASRNGFLRV